MEGPRLVPPPPHVKDYTKQPKDRCLQSSQKTDLSSVIASYRFLSLGQKKITPKTLIMSISLVTIQSSIVLFFTVTSPNS